MLRIIAIATLARSTLSAPWWHEKVVSFWYAPEGVFDPSAVALVQQHLPEITSVMSYCGIDVRDDGTIISSFSEACSKLFPALKALGVQTEIVTNSGNCSIDAFRRLWSDLTVSPRVLRDAVITANASGLNIDFEPQADNCAGAPTGTAADAKLLSTWLAAVRAQLAPIGARLTLDVASWSPVLAQYAVLAEGADRLLTMETYNGDSSADWTSSFSSFLAGTPLAQAGIGLGGWDDGKNSWWETAAAANFKVSAAKAANVPELAVFRILPKKNPPWPLEFWWPALQTFL